MSQTPYSYNNRKFGYYTFISVGKRRIVKMVVFSPTNTPGLYNIGFGDPLPDGTLDDTVVSNNQDMIKVLATVAEIIRDFTRKFPQHKIMFYGNTKQRSDLYARILKMYYQEFRLEFAISALVLQSGVQKEVDFNPDKEQLFLAFYIKRFK